MTRDESNEKKRFLVMYDYGMGGLWAYLWARSAEEIERLFPELEIHTDWPRSVGAEIKALALESEVYDIDERGGRGILSVVLKDRESDLRLEDL